MTAELYALSVAEGAVSVMVRSSAAAAAAGLGLSSGILVHYEIIMITCFVSFLYEITYDFIYI